MSTLRLQDIVKKWVATSGIEPSFRLDAFNHLLLFGNWLKENPCPKVFDSGYEFYQYLNQEILGNEAIDFVEFGVYNGYSFKIWLDINQHSDSRFFGFDSFEGLPEDWQMFSRTMKKGTFDMGGKAPEIDDHRAQFIKGIFQKSLPIFLETFTPKNRLFVHCDADLYSSTLFVLTNLNALLKPGTILLFDQFSSVTHEFRAFRDFTQSFGRNFRVLAACEPFYAKVAIELL